MLINLVEDMKTREWRQKEAFWSLESIYSYVVRAVCRDGDASLSIRCVFSPVSMDYTSMSDSKEGVAGSFPT